ncbi:MAG: Uma2 family endonuclease [Blastocatellales bacterium]
MPTLVAQPQPDRLAINLEGLFARITDEEFFELCRHNPDLRMEMSKEGDIIIMPPTGGETSGINFDLVVDFGSWAKKDGTGKGFESNALFVLPNGAKRMPDMSWIKLERWNKLTEEQKKSFPPICPDFVVELRSPSDSVSDLKAKMEEYIENGAQLGWLIDPIQKKVFVYRPNQQAEELDNPVSISGEPLLKGFTLNLHSYFG